MDLHPEDIIISIINITVLFILLRLILWKHVLRFLAERKKHVQKEMDDAENSRLEAEALHSKYEGLLGEIKERERDMIRESQTKANEESDRILKETRDKAREMIDDAEARIAEEKEKALEDAQFEVTQLATDMASRILGREVSVDDNVNAVDEFFRE